jgi:hypothetical protein
VVAWGRGLILEKRRKEEIVERLDTGGGGEGKKGRERGGLCGWSDGGECGLRIDRRGEVVNVRWVRGCCYIHLCLVAGIETFWSLFGWLMAGMVGRRLCVGAGEKRDMGGCGCLEDWMSTSHLFSIYESEY